MTWTYNLAFTTNRDRVRLLIGDTTGLVQPTEQLLQDEEINLVLPTDQTLLALDNFKLIRVAAQCCDLIVAFFSRKVTQSVAGSSIVADNKARAYQDLADKFWIMIGGRDGQMISVSAYGGGLTKTDKDVDRQDSDKTQPAFSRGMLDSVFGRTNTSSPSDDRLLG